MAEAKPVVETLLMPNVEAWQDWLARNHASCAGVWLHLGKKGRTIPAVTYAEALEVALCYGWIDGQIKTFDRDTFIQRFTPRSKKSIWSKINRTKVLELIESGKMTPPGLAAIAAAKSNGRWDAAYDSSSTAQVPTDFEHALNKNHRAKAFFESLDRNNRYSILFRLQTPVRAETRIKKIDQFIGMLARKEKFHP